LSNFYLPSKKITTRLTKKLHDNAYNLCLSIGVGAIETLNNKNRHNEPGD